MKKSYLIIGVILILIIGGLGIYFLKAPVKTPATNVNVQPSEKTSPIGSWHVNKLYMYDDTTQQFIETPLSDLGSPNGFNMEYTKDGRWCSGGDFLSNKSAECSNYDTYTIKDDVIIQNQVGLTGPESHYKWKITNGNLELTWEFLDNSTNTWSPMLRYNLEPISK